VKAPSTGPLVKISVMIFYSLLGSENESAPETLSLAYSLFDSGWHDLVHLGVGLDSPHGSY